MCYSIYNYYLLKIRVKDLKILAIDGNSIINRAFYGIRLLSNSEGLHTNAIYGFINILLKLIDAESPDGVAVAFDLKAPTFRHKMYSEYKAGRRPMPEELAEQFPLLKEWLTLYGFTCIEKEGFEADDILGTLSLAAENSGNECVIATGDRDSLQLISEKTRVLLASTKAGSPELKNYTVEKLKEDYGLSPEEMIELKALMGDSSDNIPGVAGVGPKTATDLIQRYKSIDYIYENIETLDIKDNLKNKLKADKDSAFLSRKLGTINRKVPISTNLADYKNKEADTYSLSALMTRLELFTLMKRLNIPVSKEESAGSIKKDQFDYKEVDLNQFDKKDTFDIYENFVVSNGKIASLNEEQLKDILTDESIKKRVYDYKSLLHKYGDFTGVTFDLTLAAYVCDPAAKDYSIEKLSLKYKVSLDNTEDDKLTHALLFSILCDKLTEELEKTEQLSLLTDVEVPLAKVLYEMEKYGFLVNREGIKNYGEELAVKIAELEKEIHTLAGVSFNINSPKQLGEILFVKLKLPAGKKTKTGYSTNAEILENLRYDYPIVDSILKYRQLAKLKSTYCDGLYNAISDDGRIHTTFNQTETRTGRISSLEPNLQNIPVKTDEGKKLREFFIAKDGYTLCDADYSQIELRVLASIADDNVMIDAFESGADIHTITASQVFGIPETMVLPIMRSRAKAVNFGIVYGIGAFSLSKDIGVTRAEADRYIKSYLDTYKGVASYMDDVIKKAKEDGFVKTLFGRRRYLPELKEKNGMLRAFGERVARNAPIQGTAADIIKIAMIKVNNRLKVELPSARLILQVHDELIVECPKGDEKAACAILEEEMTNAANLKVKLLVEAHSGENWLIAKG